MLRLLSIAVLVPPVVSCQTPPESTLERVRREGFVRAAYSEEPPFSFFDESTGRVGGESPEAMRAVAEELGVENVRWVRLDFGDLIPSLLQGRVDVVAAGMFRTPEREERVRFSTPTVCSAPALLVPAGSSVASIEDVARDTTLRLAVLDGSVEHSAAQELGIRGDRLLAVPDLTTGVVAVDEGSTSALAISLPTARRAVQNRHAASLEIRRYDPPPRIRTVVAGCSALAFRPQDTSLADAADRALAAYVGATRHVATLRLLGFSREDLPPPRAAR